MTTEKYNYYVDFLNKNIENAKKDGNIFNITNKEQELASFVWRNRNINR